MLPLMKSPVVFALSLAFLLAACTTDSKPAVRPAPGGVAPAAPKPGSPINPHATIAYLEREGGKWVRQGGASTNLMAQKPPGACRLRLAPGSSQTLSPSELARKAEMSVGVVGEFTVKNGVVSLANFSSGFFLTESGAFAMCRHSLAAAAGKSYVVMTRDGRVFPVRAVLASRSTNDVAIVQVEGAGFTPLPVAAAAPVGAPVWVMSHPLAWFYTFTTGMVSGYIDWFTQPGDGQTTWMTITADYASGSSGAPVLDENGAVVGVASQTRTLFSGMPQRYPQMVLKLCVPSSAILGLVQPE